MKHDESRLPLWAQQRLADARRECEELHERYTRLESAHTLLTGKNWFHLITMEDGKNMQRDPNFPDQPGYRQLWMINYDSPFPICSLGDGDTIIVGRARRWYEKEAS